MKAHLAAVSVALAAASVGLLAACSAPGGSATPRATVTVTAPPSSPATATPVAAPAQPAAPAACSSRYLGAKLGVSQGTTGSTYVVLVFTNLNNYPCTMYGYPGVALDAGTPVTPVGLSAAEDPSTPRELVTLAPHGTASALLRIMHAAAYPPGTCKLVTTRFMQIIPPNQYVPLYVGYTTQTCSNPVRILTVDAVRPGSGSS